MAVTFRFSLIDDDFGTLVFGSDMVKNWKDIKPSLIRNDTLRGVVSEYTNTFYFVKDARNRIRDIEERYGLDAIVYLKIEIGNESGHKGSFKQIGSELKANFSKTYTIDETSVKLSFSPSSFQELILSRIDLNVNHNTLKSIDDVEFQGIENNRVDVLYHTREIVETGTYKSGLNYESIQSSNKFLYVFPSLDIEAQDSDTFQSSFSQIYASSGGVDLTGFEEGSVIRKSQNDRSFKFKLEGSITLYSQGAENSRNVNLTLLKLDEFDNYIFGASVQCSDIYSMLSTQPRQLIIPYSEVDVSLKKGESLMIAIFVGTSVGANPVTTFIEASSLSLTIESVVIDAPTPGKGVLIHDAFKRNLQIITGFNEPFYSKLYGRQSQGYERNGEHSGTLIASGLMIRNFPYVKSKLNTSLKDLFQSTNAIYNTVASIKGDKLCIEKYEDVFDLNHSIVVEDVKDILMELVDKQHFLKIVTGCKDYEYEEINGINSFNASREYACPLSSATETLNNESIYRFDDYGIEFARRKKYDSSQTTDTRYDEDNFLIRAYETLPNNFNCERDEDFSLIEGIYSPSTSYNLKISPARNLIRWGNVIMSGLNKKTSGYLKFIKGDKNTNLKTQLNSENVAVSEGKDIDINILKKPVALPYFISFSSKLSVDEYNNILNNPNKTIKLILKSSENKVNLYGFIESAEYSIATGECSFKLLRANI